MIQQTPSLINCLKTASETAEKNGRKDNAVDLFCVILDNSKDIQRCFIRENLNYELISEGAKKLFDSLPDVFTDGRAEAEYLEILASAQRLCAELENGHVDVEHVFHEILFTSEIMRGWMAMAEIDIDKLVDRISKLVNLEDDTVSGFSPEEMEEMTQENFPTIKRFCKNLSQEIEDDGPNIFGREKEIKKILDILCRKERRNVILVGEPGVGRKSIVRGVAERVYDSRVSEMLQGKTFLFLDISGISAGASLMGSLEQRFKLLEKELEAYKDVVLVIDDIHQAYGTGGKEGMMDCASLLKPILTNREVSCIAITTQTDFKKTIEKDANFTRHFEKLQVKEPSKEETRAIVLSSIAELEVHHCVEIPNDTIDMIIDLCERYIPYKKFPAKVFDFIDQVGAAAANNHFTQPESLNKLWKSVQDILEKEGTSDRLVKKLEKFGKETQKWVEKTSQNPPKITPKLAMKEFAAQYNLSENQLKQSHDSSLDTLGDRLKANVFGQDSAVDKTVDILLCSKVGLREKNKPLAKLLFAGQTSCGKTELAKQIAAEYFSDDKALIKLDMSEYQDRYSITSLIGSTAGYIGYENGGRLTEFVKNNPSCVVLFDEIEKAHQDVCNLLLQIMDDGYLTDGQGSRVDFTNTIVILTGNVGATGQKNSMGFNLGDVKAEKVEHFTSEIKKHFKPEFIARVDEIVVFNPVDDTMMRKILSKSLGTTKENLVAQKMVLNIDDSLVEHLFAKIKKEECHARSIQAIVRRELDIPLAKFIVKERPEKITVKYTDKLEIENAKIT